MSPETSGTSKGSQSDSSIHGSDRTSPESESARFLDRIDLAAVESSFLSGDFDLIAPRVDGLLSVRNLRCKDAGEVAGATGLTSARPGGKIREYTLV